MRGAWNPWGGHLGRPLRRTLVVVMYLSFGVFLYALYVAGGNVTSPLLAAIVIPGAIAVYACIRLLRAPGYIGDAVDRNLDELQRTVRDRAYRVSYSIFVLIFVAIALAALLSTGSAAEWEALRLPGRFLPWLSLVAATLPTAVIAWTYPDLED